MATASDLAVSADTLAAADATVARTSRLFRDNAYVSAEGGATIEVVSPIDGKVMGTIAHASVGDIDLAVKSARHCFDTTQWPHMSPSDRAQVLSRASQALRGDAKRAELAVIESRDCGKTFEESYCDIGECAEVFAYYAELAPRFLRSTPLPASEGAPDYAAELALEPLGVVGCVTPWNFPLGQAVIKVAPALAAGCAVVLKPSPAASLTCCALGEVLAAAGAPPGAFNVVTGGPPDSLPGGGSSGQALIDHPLLDKLSFTGSGAAGRRMLEASAAKLRPTALELGGKSAFVVFADSAEYLDAVVDWTLLGIFPCTGQVCSATSRLIIHRDLEEKVVSRVIAAAAKIRVGHPLDKSTQMGPLASGDQLKRVETGVQQARKDGATVHSAQLSLPEGLKGGFYFPPTVLTGVEPGCAAWRDEIFGPVLAVRSFGTEEEAVAMANDTTYGLANAVYTKDADRLARVASRLRSGVVWQNCNGPLASCWPFGGRPGLSSGFGSEGGELGLREYVAPKTLIRAKVDGFTPGSYE